MESHPWKSQFCERTFRPDFYHKVFAFIAGGIRHAPSIPKLSRKRWKAECTGSGVEKPSKCIMINLLEDPGWGGGRVPGTRPSPIHFIFMQFSGKSWPNNRLALPFWRLPPPPPGKSWIRQWNLTALTPYDTASLFFFFILSNCFG